MTHTNNPKFSIISKYGKTAKNMAVEAVYLTVKSPDEFDPLTFIQSRLQQLRTASDDKREIYQRFWLYYGVLLVALQDEFYLSLQSELTAAYERHCATMEPDLEDGFVFRGKFRQVRTDGALMSYAYSPQDSLDFLAALKTFLEAQYGEFGCTVEFVAVDNNVLVLRILNKQTSQHKNPTWEPKPFSRKTSFVEDLGE